ncbi:MAG: 1-acyl-sn-glycerol-3-phosphate acyltransferase [Methanobacteriota archaeon]
MDASRAFFDRMSPLVSALEKYSRLSVDGIDRLPKTGAGVLAANHTGWLGLDYAFTVHRVYQRHGRIVRGLAHPAWFANPKTAAFARRAGLTEVSKDAMRDLLRQGFLVMVFPEGEKGAFKPGTGYRLEDFARGFVRVAMEMQAPIYPVSVLGGEEANPTLARIDSYEALLGSSIPIPSLPFLPKPVKWMIRFLPPVHMAGFTSVDAGDPGKVYAVKDRVRAAIQEALDEMRKERGNPWI